MSRFVEAIENLEFVDEIGVDAASTPIAGIGLAALHVGGDDLPGPPAGDTIGSTRVMPLQPRNHLLHGAARSGLDDDEVQHHDAEQGRHHQQQTAQDVTGHGAAADAGTAHHVSGKPSDISGTTSGRPNLFQ